MPNHRSRFARVGAATLPLFALMTASVAAAAPGRGGKPTICQQLVKNRPRRQPHQPVFAQPCRTSRRSRRGGRRQRRGRQRPFPL